MNKNTKALRKRIKKAGHKGLAVVEHLQPVKDWHSQSKPMFNIQRFPTARVGGEGVISRNPRRLSVMRVCHNTGTKGASITVHEPESKEAKPYFVSKKKVEGYEKATRLMGNAPMQRFEMGNDKGEVKERRKRDKEGE